MFRLFILLAALAVGQCKINKTCIELKMNEVNIFILPIRYRNHYQCLFHAIIFKITLCLNTSCCRFGVRSSGATAPTVLARRKTRFFQEQVRKHRTILAVLLEEEYVLHGIIWGARMNKLTHLIKCNTDCWMKNCPRQATLPPTAPAWPTAATTTTVSGNKTTATTTTTTTTTTTAITTPGNNYPF